MQKRGTYDKKDKDGNKLVKKARASDVRRGNLDAQWEKKLKQTDNIVNENKPKHQREMKKIEKKIEEDHRREARRDERYMNKK